MLTFYCHREVNAITRVCGYFGTNRKCSKKINGTISISPCPDECPVCQNTILNVNILI